MSSSAKLMKLQKKAKRPPKAKYYNPLTQRYKWKSCPKYQTLDKENTGFCIDKSCALGKELNFSSGRCTTKKCNKYENLDTKHTGRCITKKCPPGKILNKKTARCKKKHPQSKKKTTKKKSTSSNKQIIPLQSTQSILHIDDISTKDFFYDPCYIFQKIKSHLEKDKTQHHDNELWKRETLLKVEEILPIVSETSPKTYTYGDTTIKIKNKRTESTNGIIYNGIFDKKKVVIKVPKNATPEICIMEYFIHATLFCHLRTITKDALQIARIPKLECIIKKKIQSSSSIPKYEYMIVMEYLDGDFSDLLSKSSPTINDTRMNLQMINKICQLFHHLQNRFEFMHRDFYISNIMYKYTSSQKTNIIPYIIDFGLSTMRLQIKREHPHTQNDWINYNNKIYPRPATRTAHISLNRSHDFRMLFTSILDFKSSIKGNNLYILIMAYYLCNSLRSYLVPRRKNEEPLFWDTYHQIFQIDDPYFHPAFIKAHTEMSIVDLNHTHTYLPKQMCISDNNKSKTNKLYRILRSVRGHIQKTMSKQHISIEAP